MSDLIAFLNARLDEDERKIKAWDDTFYRRGPGEPIVLPPGRNGYTIEFVAVPMLAPRMLAEIAAKRAIIDLHEEAASADASKMMGYEIHQNDGAREYMRDVIRAISSAYASHPDYDQEWKP